MTSISPDRAAEIEAVITRVTRWAKRDAGVAGLLLVGSCARGTARVDSDIDFVVLAHDPARYSQLSWADELALGDLIRKQAWGPIVEWRFLTGKGLEVEIGIGPLTWASVDPIDAGTRRVVSDGAWILHDPSGALAVLVAACRPDR